MKTKTEIAEEVLGTDGARKQKPSKTATLSSAKTLLKNLQELQWSNKEWDEKLDKLIEYIKSKIIDEL